MPGPVSVTTTSTVSSSISTVEIVSSPARRFLHRLDRIAHQVQHHLLNLDLVDEHESGAAIEAKRDAHAGFLDPDQRQRARLLDQLREAFDVPLGIAAGHELAHPADDLARAQSLVGRAFDGVPDHARLLGLDAVEKAPASVEIAGDRGQGLVQLMRQGRRHLAHRAETRNMDERGLHIVQPLLGLLPFR